MRREEEAGGLTWREAAQRLEQYGANALASKKRISAMKIFAGQFRDLMVLILLAATAVSAALGEAGEALTIVVIVLINALLGFFQEYRTEKTLDALKKLSAPECEVLRDGTKQTIDAALVVPDDILLIKAGDRIAADGVVLSAAALACDESMLTGESDACEKRPATGDMPDKQSAKESMVFMGTTVVKGRGTVRVTATGMSTEMGAIAGMLDEIEEDPTPLQKKLDQVGRVIGYGCLLICAIVAGTGILRGESPLDMLITGISLAVAAVPEGLPAIVTISLALAVRRILKRNALIKKLHAVETLGCATVVCSDKTGTLTENRMTAKRVFTLSQEMDLDRPEDREKAERSASAKKLFETAAFCNNASMARQKRGFLGQAKQVAEGEPTEAALLRLASEFGVSQSDFYRTDELPFDSARKRMSVYGTDSKGKQVLFVKGAPDLLLPRCVSVLTDGGVQKMTALHRDRISRAQERMASDALRVLGFAYREYPAGTPFDRAENGLVFVGLAGLMDPPRKEAFDAVAACRTAKIRPVMITGDHSITAKAIASQLDIFREGDVLLTGEMLDRMSDEELSQACEKCSVYARVTPGHKLRIVRALKRRGEIVAMTGDGVNDAPALKEANIGVAMGIGGTDVTKEAASVILLDDNFATLVAAIEEGRVIFKNIRRFLRYLLSCNTGEVITMFFGMLMGMPVVLTPIQLLLVNLVTDGLPAIALGLEKADRDVMKEKPRDAEASIFSDGLMGKIVTRGILIGLTTLGVFSFFASAYGDLTVARTGALMTLIMTQLFHVFECRSEKRGILELNPFSNPLLFASVLISISVMLGALYVPAVSALFLTAPLSRAQVLIIILCSMMVPIFSSVSLTLSRHARRIIPANTSLVPVMAGPGGRSPKPPKPPKPARPPKKPRRRIGGGDLLSRL